MKKKFTYVILFLAVAISSCQYQRNNTIDQKDFNAGNKRIYGENPDSSAYQLKIVYPAKPELAAKADEIKNILYP